MFHDLPPFPGFRPAAFQFLRDLKANNDRAWFQPRKTVYEDECLWPLRCLVADCARQAPAFGLPLTGDPKRSLFRIYRDTRFSTDKTPYKTHLSAVLSRSGDKDEPGAVYVHLEPDGASFIAGGTWMPPAPLLRSLRTSMADDPDRFLALLHGLEADGFVLETNEALKRMPQGFEAFADAPIAPYLRWKSLVAWRRVPDEAVATPFFTSEVLAAGQALKPLLEAVWTLTEPTGR